MESPGPDPSQTELPARPPKRAAFWAWPLIVISALAIVFAPRMLPRAAELNEVEDSAAGLVVLQIQARVIVAAAAFDLAQAKRELEGLNAMATNDAAAAAIASLHLFIDPAGDGPESADAFLDRRLEKEDANVEFIERVRSNLAEGVDDTERESLRVSLGTFTDYFPARGEPLTWPKKQEIQKRSFTTLIAVAATTLGALGLGLAGLVALIIGLVKWHNGTLAPAKRGNPQLGPGLLEGFAIFMVFLFSAQVAGWGDFHWSAQFILLIVGVVMVWVWPRWRSGMSSPDIRQALGLHRGKGFFREFFAGVAGYLSILPLAALGLIVGLVLSAIAGAIRGAPIPPPAHPIVGMMEGGWVALVFVFLMASVLAPVTEEITFRGAFFGGLRSRWKFLASGLVTGFIFAVIHPQGIFAIPALMAVGFGLAMIREWRGSLIASMTAHAINNSLLLGGALLMLK